MGKGIIFNKNGGGDGYCCQVMKNGEGEGWFVESLIKDCVQFVCLCKEKVKVLIVEKK